MMCSPILKLVASFSEYHWVSNTVVVGNKDPPYKVKAGLLSNSENSHPFIEP